MRVVWISWLVAFTGLLLVAGCSGPVWVYAITSTGGINPVMYSGAIGPAAQPAYYATLTDEDDNE